MNYTTESTIDILSRTPAILRDLLHGLGREWTEATEGPGTWSPRDVIGHLIHGEKTDWIARAEIVLGPSKDKRFPPFVRDEMLRSGAGKTVEDLLAEFASLRAKNIKKLRALDLTDAKLDMKGIHPEFGEVTLRQHLSTWAAHDLSHISQVVRVLAGQYRGEVGPWKKYLRILD